MSQALLQNDKWRAGSIVRVPAEEIERLIHRALGSAGQACSSAEALQNLVERVILGTDRVEIVKATTEDALADSEEIPASRTVVVMAKLAPRNRARILDDGSAGPNPALMRALGRAHEWRGWMEQGEAMSYRAIAKRAGSLQVQEVPNYRVFLASHLSPELVATSGW